MPVKNNLLIELSGEHPELPLAELEIVLNAFAQNKKNRLLYVNINKVSERLAVVQLETETTWRNGLGDGNPGKRHTGHLCGTAKCSRYKLSIVCVMARMGYSAGNYFCMRCLDSFDLGSSAMEIQSQYHPASVSG